MSVCINLHTTPSSDLFILFSLFSFFPTNTIFLQISPKDGLDVKLSGSGANGSPPTTLSPTMLIVEWKCKYPHESCDKLGFLLVLLIFFHCFCLRWKSSGHALWSWIYNSSRELWSDSVYFCKEMRWALKFRYFNIYLVSDIIFSIFSPSPLSCSLPLWFLFRQGLVEVVMLLILHAILPYNLYRAHSGRTWRIHERMGYIWNNLLRVCLFTSWNSALQILLLPSADSVFNCMLPLLKTD